VGGDKDNPDSQGFFVCAAAPQARSLAIRGDCCAPKIRDDRYTNTWRRVSWDEALDIVRRLRKVGPEAVGRWAGHGSFTPGSAVTVAIMQRFAKYERMSDWQPA
jgi:hypothetical protein